MTPEPPRALNRVAAFRWLQSREPSALPASRRAIGFGLLVTLLPILTAGVLVTGRALSLGSILLLFLLAVVAIAVVGGPIVGVLSAVASFLLANWYFTPPYHTFIVDQRDSLVSLLVFVLVALIVSITVDLAARQRVAAARNRIELQLLARFASQPVGELSLLGLMTEIQKAFELSAVALVVDGQPVAHVGPAVLAEKTVRVDIDAHTWLIVSGPTMFAEDRGMLTSLAGAAARAWEGQRLAEQAAQAERLEATDRVRSALLAAVGHDLRTPLASVKTAVSGLTQTDVQLSPQDQRELLATVEDSADRLGDLISNLLDMSRLQAGALSALMQPVAVDAVVAQALLHVSASDVSVDVPDDLPAALADPGLLERVVANLVDNARRHGAGEGPVEVAAQAGDDNTVALHIIDHGSGVAQDRWESMFKPFQRFDDRTSGGGVGLGLAIARGFTEAMGGSIRPTLTPGGGLTITVTLKQTR